LLYYCVDTIQSFVFYLKRPIINDDNKRHSDKSEEDNRTAFHRTESFICRINVEEVFLMVDNNNLIMIWERYCRWMLCMYNPEGVDANQPKKRTYSCSPSFSRLSSLISPRSYLFIKTISFFSSYFFSLSALEKNLYNFALHDHQN